MTVKLKVTLLSLVSIAVVIALVVSINPDMFTTGTCVSYHANIRTKDEIQNASFIILASPTGKKYVTKFENDDIEFNVIELEVHESLKGDIAGKINIIQTARSESDPVLKKGKTYLLFLEKYVGDIPKTEGAYVAQDGPWSYYEVKNNTLHSVIGPMGDIEDWLNSTEKNNNKKVKESLLMYLRNIKKRID